MRLRNVFDIVCSVTVLACACLFGCAGENSTADWVTASTGELVLTVQLEGDMNAVDSDAVGPPPIPSMWNYKLAYLAPDGEAVEKGTPVVAFDATELREQLQAKENERDTAATELGQRTAAADLAARSGELELAEARARLNKTRLQAHVPEDLTASLQVRLLKFDLEDAEAKVKHLEKRAIDVRARERTSLSQLRSQRTRAAGRVSEIEAQIARMRIPAPRAGTVIVSGDGDDKAKIGDSVWRGRTVLEIASLDAMEGRGIVDEMDTSKIAVGQPVRLTLEAHPDHEMLGKLTSIAKSVQARSPIDPSKVQRVRLSIEPMDGLRLRPGMRFRGTIEYARIADALLVPIEAVVITASGPAVLRRNGDNFDVVAVELGERDAKNVQILSGIVAGDRVALDDLRSGTN